MVKLLGMKTLPNDYKIILDSDQISRSLTRICYEIIEQNKNLDQIVLIGIKTRGITIANRIALRLEKLEGISCPVAAIDISYFRDDDKVNKSEVPTLPFDIKNKVVILVDDVLYTGRTIRAALDTIMSIDRPQCIRLATLIDRGHREIPIRPDYIGKNIPSSKNEIIRVFLNENDQKEEVIIYAV